MITWLCVSWMNCSVTPQHIKKWPFVHIMNVFQLIALNFHPTFFCFVFIYSLCSYHHCFYLQHIASLLTQHHAKVPSGKWSISEPGITLRNESDRKTEIKVECENITYWVQPTHFHKVSTHPFTLVWLVSLLCLLYQILSQMFLLQVLVATFFHLFHC